jgi:hypothetical protein
MVDVSIEAERRYFRERAAESRARVKASGVTAITALLSMTDADVARFRKHLVTLGPDECWPWTDRNDKDGYGKFVIQGRDVRTHRVAFLLANGTIDPRRLVRHVCDNPPCCNPAHLLQGTAKQNTGDMFKRGRAPIGERRPCAKLTNEQAREIYQRVHAGEQGLALAAEFGVTPALISAIKNERVWRWQRSA